MAIYRKESLETLRQKIDLVDVLGAHMDLKKAGAAYKALCPFHDEKTPSFTIQKGDTHYHCFGCGAHGDAIQFLISHLRMSFSEAVENLAQRYHVPLERVDATDEPKGPSKKQLQDALSHACEFYHFILLHTPEGHEALKYLYHRGIDLDFIQHFHIGLSPKAHGVFRKMMHSKGVSTEVMLEAGLLAQRSEGGERDFFYDRIMIPIHNTTGAVIGFSGRKYKETTTGGKYVNTQETAVFKKSRVLFGLNYSRKRIAKERKAIIVEGQIDALRLIQEGFNITVAGQGTAFGDGHVKELLTLGVVQVYLALDADQAGQEAAMKIGNLFQKEGVEVLVVPLPAGSDPDAYLKKEGPQKFLGLLKESVDYLTFVVGRLSQQLNMNSPAGKKELIKTVVTQIRSWEHPVMVHESLRKLARLAQVPEDMVGVGQQVVQNIYMKKSDYAGMHEVNPNLILESDLLRWLILIGERKPDIVNFTDLHLTVEDLQVPVCKELYRVYVEAYKAQSPRDLLSLGAMLQTAEAQELLGTLMQRKVNLERAEQHMAETILKILERNWMQKREAIRSKIDSGTCSDEEVMALVKQFDVMRQNPPQLKGNA